MERERSANLNFEATTAELQREHAAAADIRRNAKIHEDELDAVVIICMNV